MLDASIWMLAQTEGSAPPPNAPGGPATTSTPEATTAPGQAGTSQPADPLAPPPNGPNGQGGGAGIFGGSTGMLLVLILVVMIVFMFSGQRKEKKKRAEMLSRMKKGSRVQTIGGILGTVVEVRDDEIIVKVDENANTRLRFARSAIQSVIEDPADKD